MIESIHSPKTIDEWNTLFTDCVHASSANMKRTYVCTKCMSLGRVTYSIVHDCGLLINQRLPCRLPSKVLTGWKSC